MVNTSVLILNQNYQPLNICQARRAVVLLFQGKAEVIENGSGVIHAVSCSFPLPSVIRLNYIIKRPPFQRRLARFEVFNRDRYTCQYCGKETRELTLDHVIPRYRGGERSWENVVSACRACNRRKAGRTPTEAGMKLVRQPFAPRPRSFFLPYDSLRTHKEWAKFVGEV